MKSMNLKVLTYICFYLLSIFAFASYSYAINDENAKSYSELCASAAEMMEQDKYKEALRLMDLAVNKDPNNPEAYVNRGAIWELLGQSYKAIDDERTALRRAKDKDKKNCGFRSLAHQNLSAIYLHRKDLAKAEGEARIAVLLDNSDPGGQECLGNVLEKKGKTREALIAYRRALSLCSNTGLFKLEQKLKRKIAELESNK